MLSEVVRFVHSLSCTFSITINGVLALIVIFKTPNALRSYSIILLNFALIESSTAAISLFIFNRPMDTDKHLIHAITGPCRLIGLSRLCFIGSAFLASGHSHVYLLLGITFCYRYYVINYSAPKRSFILFGLTLAYVPNATIHILFAATPMLDSTTLKSELIMNHPEYDFNVGTRTEMIIGAEMNWTIRLAFVWFISVIFPVYIAIIIVSILFNRVLTENLKMSEKSKIMHRDIMRGLIVQAMLPLFYFLGIGIFLAQKFHLLNCLVDIGHLIFTIAAMTLTASPLSTLFFIRPYRQAIISFMYCIYNPTVSVAPLSSDIRHINANVFASQTRQ